MIKTDSTAANGCAIEAIQLSKVYREGLFRRKQFKALNDVSFQVRAGSVFGLLGPNGAGKTTFVKTLLGIIRKTKGDARVFGLPAGSLRARKSIGYLPERLALPEYLTGYQCLEYCGGLSGMSAGKVRGKRDELLDLVGLGGWGKSQVKKYSKGMVQRLGLAQALIHDPKLLILDEPTDGLDPKARAGVREILHRLCHQGVTIFLNSHLLQEVEQICQDVAIMAEGSVKYCGPVGDVSGFIDQARGIKRGLEIVLELSGDAQRVEDWKNARGLDAGELVVADGHWKLKTTFQAQQEIDALVDQLRKFDLSIHSLVRTVTSLEDSFLHLVGHDLGSSHSNMEQAGKRS